MKRICALLAAFLYYWASQHPMAARNPSSIEYSSLEEISHTQYNKIYAISDVHGMYDHLVTLLRKAKIIDERDNWNASNSLLVIVGDSINKGPKSLPVLDLWIKLEEQSLRQNGRVVHLLGNHEAELLADPMGIGFNQEFADELSKVGLNQSDIIKPDSKYGHFLRAMPGFLSVGSWLFFHAGYMPEDSFSASVSKISELMTAGEYKNDLLIGDDSFLEQKDWWKANFDKNMRKVSAAGYDGLVFGHKPKAFGVEGKIFKKSRAIKIDTGMAPNGGSYSGEILLIENSQFDHPFAIDSKGNKRAL